MVTVGGIDYGVGALGFSHQQRRIVQTAEDGRNAEPRQLGGLLRASRQTGDLVPRLKQPNRHGPADVTRRTGDKHIHREFLAPQFVLPLKLRIGRSFC